MNVKLYFFACIIAIIFSACKTYYIPVESFKQQFNGLDTTKRVTMKTPYGNRVSYNTYPIDVVKCIDKTGSQMVLKSAPSLEIRFTDNQNKRKTFYFDLIYIDGDKVTGVESRFMPWIKATVLLSNIKTIEIQDDKKGFSYEH